MRGRVPAHGGPRRERHLHRLGLCRQCVLPALLSLAAVSNPHYEYGHVRGISPLPPLVPFSPHHPPQFRIAEQAFHNRTAGVLLHSASQWSPAEAVQGLTTAYLGCAVLRALSPFSEREHSPEHQGPGWGRVQQYRGHVWGFHSHPHHPQSGECTHRERAGLRAGRQKASTGQRGRGSALSLWQPGRACLCQGTHPPAQGGEECQQLESTADSWSECSRPLFLSLAVHVISAPHPLSLNSHF